MFFSLSLRRPGPGRTRTYPLTHELSDILRISPVASHESFRWPLEIFSRMISGNDVVPFLNGVSASGVWVVLTIDKTDFLTLGVL